MSYVAGEISRMRMDCSCGWRGEIGRYRAHLVRDHCNVEGCFALAEALVSFGYRDPQFVLIGARLGVCGRHRQHLRVGSMHMLLEAPRRPVRR